MKQPKPETIIEPSAEGARHHVFKRRLAILCLPLLSASIALLTLLSLKREIYFYDLSNDNRVEVFSDAAVLNDKLRVGAKYCSALFRFNCEDISSKIVRKSTPDTDTIGSVKVEYYVDYANETKEFSKEIEVIDTVPPEITLEEGGVFCPENFVEPGFKATDNYSKDLTDKVTTSREDNVIYYRVSDEAGNETTVKRELTIGDNIAPNLSLNGYDTEYVIRGQNFKDPGYSVSDNCDKSLKVSVSGSVDTNKNGTYTLTYKTSDSSGNSTFKTRSVKVFEPKTDPSITPSGKVIYLTFDDGPGQYTEQLLNVLAKYNVKATFFVTNQFSKYQHLIKREKDEGHAIGIHSFSHQYTNIYSSVNNYFDDLNKMDEIIFNQAGVHPKIIRFPGGSSNSVRGAKRGIMTALANETAMRGYQYFDWNVASNDTGTSSRNVIYHNVINGIKSHNYSVVLQHDIKSASVNAVEDIIKFGLANGYAFKPLDTTSPTAHHRINN